MTSGTLFAAHELDGDRADGDVVSSQSSYALRSSAIGPGALVSALVGSVTDGAVAVLGEVEIWGL